MNCGTVARHCDQGLGVIVSILGNRNDHRLLDIIDLRIVISRAIIHSILDPRHYSKVRGTCGI